MSRWLFLMGILWSMRLLSQVPDYLPNGAEWRIRITNGGNYPYTFYEDDFVYYIAGDSTIGGYTYRKIFTRGIYTEEYLLPEAPTVYTPYNQFKGLLRQDGKKMYSRVQSQGQFIDTLFYNFDLTVGDLLPPTWIQSFTNVHIINIDSILVNGSYFKKFQIEMEDNQNSYDSLLIEGLGHSGGLLERFYAPWSHTNKLMCFAIDGISYYEGPNEFDEEMCVFNLDLMEQSNIETKVYPNPSTNVLFLQWKEPDQIKSIRVTDIVGSCFFIPTTLMSSNELQLDVSSMSSGLYLIQVDWESGKFGTVSFEKN